MFFFNLNRNIYSSCHLKSKDLRGVKQQTRFKPNTHTPPPPPPPTKKTHTPKKKEYVDEAQARSAALEIVHRHDPINSTMPLSILSNPKNNGLKK